MTGNTRFQRLIPETLHSNPLEKLEIAGSKTYKMPLLWSGNSPEPRLPFILTNDPAYPPTLEDGTHVPVPPTNFKLLPPDEIKTLIFCLGQVYFLLNQARALNNLSHIAIVRVEQLNPFPFWEACTVIDFYKNLEEIVWCQEESFNSGAWSFVEPRLDTVIRHTDWYKSGKVYLYI